MRTLEETIEQLRKPFRLKEVLLQRKDLAFVAVEKRLVLPMIHRLKNEMGFTHFVFLTAVDWIEEKRFQLTYTLNQPEYRYDLAIRTYIPRNKPVMESAHHLWEHIATYQRELREMYGIDFPGSPRLEEPFLLEGWDDIPPMRREFDTLKYAEETFFPRPGRKTHDPATYMKEKLRGNGKK